ncbi:MAG TPA: hypothetical protein ENH31_04575 [Nitrospirae bacterium]|nr:hypothetical protein [Nitrospirota bacterium]
MILGLFLFVIGSIILFTVILGMFSADSMTMSYKNNTLQLGQTPIMLFKNALAANWVFIIFGGSLLVLAALLVSHRIAGPQFRFEMTLKNMIAGNLKDTVSLRTHDEGSELAAQINAFNYHLSQKIREIDKHSQAIDELTEMMDRTDVSSLSKDSLLEKFKSIRKQNNAIRKVTTSFTIADE